MFRDIHFLNDGVISLIDLTTMGDSSKRGDTEKIGKFDSGLKYAISILVRHGVDFKITSKNFEYTFGSVVQTDECTGKEKELIQIEQHDLTSNEVSIISTAFAVNLGYEWELWMAIRELYSNCIDEGGSVYFDEHVDNTDTIISINGCEQIENIIDQWGNYFLDTSLTPIYANNTVQIFYNPNDHLKLYKQGVLVHEETERASKYVYNYSQASIDEMRMLNDYEDYVGNIRGAISHTDSKELILDLIENEVFEFEDDIGFGSYLSSTWVDVINAYYREHGAIKTYKSLMRGFMSNDKFEIGTKTVATERQVWFEDRVQVTPEIVVEKVLTFEERVVQTCADQGFAVEYPIVLSTIERIKCVGDVFKKTIYVSESWNADDDVWEIVKAQYKIKYNNHQDRIYKDLAGLLKK